jgi:hypothetical protein
MAPMHNTALPELFLILAIIVLGLIIVLPWVLAIKRGAKIKMLEKMLDNEKQRFENEIKFLREKVK